MNYEVTKNKLFNNISSAGWISIPLWNDFGKDDDERALEAVDANKCKSSNVYEFPLVHLKDDSLNRSVAEQALRKVMFTSANKVFPTHKGSGWPTCKFDSSKPFVIKSELTYDDKGVKIVQAWIECEECEK